MNSKVQIMKNKYVREIRHIVANYSLTNSSTGYHIDSRSLTYKIVRDLIKRNLVECNKIDGQFLFVSPGDSMKIAFGNVKTENQTPPIPELNSNLIWKSHTENNQVNLPVIIAA
jgi:hypothetical protein